MFATARVGWVFMIAGEEGGKEGRRTRHFGVVLVNLEGIVLPGCGRREEGDEEEGRGEILGRK